MTTASVEWPQTVTVIVPTYRRTESLKQCLAALAAQTRPADEVLVTVRDTDAETQALLGGPDAPFVPGLRRVLVCEGGVIAAMNAGLAVSRGDVVALTDDDALPRPDWLERILACFATEERLAGVGGRDWLPWNGEEPDTADVGRVQWFGRLVGNHHRGVGPPREVDFLKGVNCAYQGDLLRALGFDARLRGGGAQVHWELSLGLSLRRSGWRLLYDPALLVDHRPAVRHDADQNNRPGGNFAEGPQTDAVGNGTLVLLEHMDAPRRAAFLVWSLLVGTRGEPGLLQALRLLARRDRHALPRLRATQRGLRVGWQDWRRAAGEPPRPAPAAPSRPGGVESV